MPTQPVKTRLYRWEGTDLTGAEIKGETSAESQAMIRVLLRRQGISARNIRRKAHRGRPGGPSIKALDIMLFTRQLASLIKAGISLLQALNVIAEGVELPAMRQLVNDLKQDISAGTSLANALRKKPAHFDALFCNLIDAGEQAGA